MPLPSCGRGENGKAVFPTGRPRARAIFGLCPRATPISYTYSYNLNANTDSFSYFTPSFQKMSFRIKKQTNWYHHFCGCWKPLKTAQIEFKSGLWCVFFPTNKNKKYSLSLFCFWIVKILRKILQKDFHLDSMHKSEETKQQSQITQKYQCNKGELQV